MINVVCLKWGDKYAPDYVNRLYGMVRRNLTLPFVFHCMTENPLGLKPEINVLPLPDLGLHGWWYKLYLFKNDFFGLRGEIFFLDLDIVITGSLDDLLTYMPHKFCIARDKTPGSYNSSVMRFKSGSMGFIWETFIYQKKTVMDRFHGDQDWIQRLVLSAEIYPFPLVVSYKFDCDARPKFCGGGAGKWLRKRGFLTPSKQASLPENARIVLFHGKPDPEDVLCGPYDKYRQAPWISTYWRE